MALTDDIRIHVETEEHQTVGNSFGGTEGRHHNSYSVVSIRRMILDRAPFMGSSRTEQVLRQLYTLLPRNLFSQILACLLRFSFLIELTNLRVGSTKMKTRWIPGLILMPQEDSFEPVRGSFEPGNDPRAASFDNCLNVFTEAASIVHDHLREDPNLAQFLLDAASVRRVPYEFPLTYADPSIDTVHVLSNIRWALNDDFRWLQVARRLLRESSGPVGTAMREIEKKKLEVKVFKTDRALTGKDKTNRAKRWEVLFDDFQHATLEECWSAERKLTADLISFQDAPDTLRRAFIERELIPADPPPTRCPVTLELLSFENLARAALDPTHGVADYQVGHLHPLKRGGKHNMDNVCWQSAHGNRIQGDRTIEETGALLDAIAARRTTLLP